MAALAIGCGEPALLIEVETPANVNSVELMLAQDACPDCGSGMAPPGAMAKINGKVYYTDGDARVFADVEPNAPRARFWIEPGASDHLSRVVAIGFDARNIPVALTEVSDDITVSQHLGERWNVDLETRPIATALPVNAFDIDTDDSVMLWRPPATTVTTAEDHASCLLVKHASDQTTDFLVPPDDADCDGFIDNECDRTWYDYRGPEDTSEPCIGVGAKNACRIGSRATCLDGGDDQSCAYTGKYCIPDIACTQCDMLSPSCFDNLSSVAGVARLECNIGLSGIGGMPPFNACSPSVTVDAPYFAGCANPTFATVASPFTTVNPLMFPVGSSTVSFTLGAATTACKIPISITASLDTVPGGIFHPAALLLNGVHGDVMAVPLIVKFHSVGVCSPLEASCTFLPDPTAASQNVWNCGK